MSEADLLAEADRLMTVCNSCRYCEGLCAVFPAMEQRRVFTPTDLKYFANLCHACGACYDDCQFAPPHEFAVNVPLTLSKLRRETYAEYAWPAPLGAAFKRGGLVATGAVVAGLVLFLAGIAAMRSPQALFTPESGPGAFYRLMPHDLMAWLFGLVFVYAVAALTLGVRRFWREMDRADPLALSWADLWRSMRDAGSLRYLDGGGVGCLNDDETLRDHRRVFHHMVFYGFALCFAATSVASLYHFLLGREAPYAWWEPPVLLGTLGGIGLVVGAAGLLAARAKRRPELRDDSQMGLDVGFTLLLLVTGLTGLALLVLRTTPAMGALLAVHLALVLALFVTLPYGRFVHGLYRFAALVRYAAEMRRAQTAS